MKADPAIAALHRDTDAFMAIVQRKSVNMGNPVTCTAGCSACCYEPVFAERGEIDHALGRVTPALRARIKLRTQEWLNKLLPSGLLSQKQPKIWDYRPLRAACPFLENNLCSIYSDRPAACRYHCAIGPASACHDEALRRNQRFLLCPQAEERYQQNVVRLRRALEFDHVGLLLADILLGQHVCSADYQAYDKAAVCRVADELEKP